MTIRIATAGWSMPALSPERARAHRPSALERYARTLGACEINSTFYRHHRPATFARWAGSVPDGFRFSVKLPKVITHDARLRMTTDARSTLERFAAEVGELGDRLGPLLVQMPPSLEFDADVLSRFVDVMRASWSGNVACEPRHASWFTDDVASLLSELRLARVGADPARVEAAAIPGGWNEFAYLRLHGSPRTYYSSYADGRLEDIAARLGALAEGPAREVWCVFDNTASGAALGDALELGRLLAGSLREGRIADSNR